MDAVTTSIPFPYTPNFDMSGAKSGIENNYKK
jgi:hypothetical protein